MTGEMPQHFQRTPEQQARACDCGAPRCERDGCQDKPTPAALDVAYSALLWISEYPNRCPEDDDSVAVGLAEHAREALHEIEQAERRV